MHPLVLHAQCVQIAYTFFSVQILCQLSSAERDNMPRVGVIEIESHQACPHTMKSVCGYALMSNAAAAQCTQHLHHEKTELLSQESLQQQCRLILLMQEINHAFHCNTIPRQMLLD